MAWANAMPHRWPEPETRFWSYVDKTDECWVWKSPLTAKGYGRLRWDGRMQMAHRVSLELAGISVPDGREVDHLCRVRHCVRPDHLEVVSHRLNVIRGDNFAAINAGKLTCKHGHPLVYKNGRRRCPECDRRVSRESKRRWRAKSKGQEA